MPVYFVLLIVLYQACLLYTSDAADERSSVDLGGRRIIKKKNKIQNWLGLQNQNNKLTYSSYMKRDRKKHIVKNNKG